MGWPDEHPDDDPADDPESYDEPEDDRDDFAWMWSAEALAGRYPEPPPSPEDLDDGETEEE